MSFLIAIGVDIAKLKFDVACSVAGKYKHKTFTNDTPGHAAFATWLVALCGDVKPLICMEATGSYGLRLADFLTHQGHAVSVVNPAKIHAFAKSELSRAKTDKADAELIARYAFTMNPPLWISPPANIRELRALVRRVEHLLEMIRMERNRQDTANAKVAGSINTVWQHSMRRSKPPAKPSMTTSTTIQTSNNAAIYWPQSQALAMPPLPIC